MDKQIIFCKFKNSIHCKKKDGTGIGFLYLLLKDVGRQRSGLEKVISWFYSDEEDYCFNETFVEKIGNNIKIKWDFELDNPDAPCYVILQKYFSEFLEKWAELIKTEYGILKIADEDGIVSMELTEGDAEYNTPDIFKNR